MRLARGHRQQHQPAGANPGSSSIATRQYDAGTACRWPICPGIIGTDGARQVRTGCFGNPPDSNQAPALVQSKRHGRQDRRRADRLASGRDGQPAGGEQPQPRPSARCPGRLGHGRRHGHNDHESMGAAGALRGLADRLSREPGGTSYYGQFPNGVLLQPGSSTTWPFVAVNLDIGITVARNKRALGRRPGHRAVLERSSAATRRARAAVGGSRFLLRRGPELLKKTINHERKLEEHEKKRTFS